MAHSPRAETAAHRPTIRDVAAAAGVSPTTVSHALSGTRPVRAATRERVAEIAKSLGYTPDRLASGLRRQRSGVIGLVSDHIAMTPFAGPIIRGAQEAALERDTVVMVLDSDGDPGLERKQTRVLIDHRVDGLLLARMFHQTVERPAAVGGMPMVLVDAVPGPGWKVPSVAPDEQAIAATAVSRLTDAGHRRIGFVTISEDTPASRGREIGYRAAMDAAGLGGGRSRIERSTSDAAGGRIAGRRLLDQPAADRPTAIFCFNDQMAMGVYQAAADLDLVVPYDCSVIGVDNLEIVAAALVPGLTTIALPHHEMGRWGMVTLLDWIDGVDLTAKPPKLIRCVLIERGSVAPPAPTTR